MRVMSCLSSIGAVLLLSVLSAGPGLAASDNPRLELREKEGQIAVLRQELEACRTRAAEIGTATDEGLKDLEFFRDRLADPGPKGFVVVEALGESLVVGGQQVMVMTRRAFESNAALLSESQRMLLFTATNLRTSIELERVKGLIAARKPGQEGESCDPEEAALAKAEAEADALRRLISTQNATGYLRANDGAGKEYSCNVDTAKTICTVTSEKGWCEFEMTYAIPASFPPAVKTPVVLGSSYNCSYPAGPGEGQTPAFTGFTFGMVPSDGYSQGYAMEDGLGRKFEGWDGSYRCVLTVGSTGNGQPLPVAQSRTCAILFPDTFPMAPPYRIQITVGRVGWVARWSIDD